MDFDEGKSVLLQALALLNDEGELSKKIEDIILSIRNDKTRTVTQICEVLVLQREDAERRKKCVELLEGVIKWWKLLVNDREKLLITISSLELEKEEILRKQTDPTEIYGPLLEATRKKPRLDVQQKDTQTGTADDAE